MKRRLSTYMTSIRIVALLLVAMAVLIPFLHTTSMYTENAFHYLLLSIIFLLMILLVLFWRKEKLQQETRDALIKSKQRYEILAEMSPVGIFHTDASGYTTYVNPRWCQITGMKREAALGNGWLNAVHPEDRAALTMGWQNATKNQDVSLSEYRFISPDGSIAWVLGQAVPERNTSGQIIGYVGTTTDITTRKKAEVEIAKVNKEKETALNRINDSMISLDNDWRYTFLNDAAVATHPLGKEETIGKTVWEIHPEIKVTAFWDKCHEAMNTRQVVEFENFYAPVDTWFSVKIYPAHDGLTVMYSDITESKKTAAKIIKNEIRLRKAQELGKLGYWQQELNSDIVWASKEAMAIYGFPAAEGEMKREAVSACIIDIAIVKEAATRLVERNEGYNIEFRIQPADGSPLKYIAALAELEKNEKGEPLRINGTLQDITERIKARNEIIKEKNLSDSIINSLPGIFYLFNSEGKFLRWNTNFETITGYTGEEIRHMHPLDFFIAEEKEILQKKISNTSLTGEDNVQADFLLKSNEKIPFYFTGMAIDYEETRCIAGVGIDFSERVKAQQQIKETTAQLRKLTAHLQHIREEERKRIGREIHDELGQQLTAIKMDIAWIDKKTLAENNAVKNKLKNVIGLLDGSNLSIRRILSELRPVVLDDRGLLEAIEWLGKQLSANTGIALHFTSTNTDIALPEPVSTCIFRIYQEALTNIIRYAGASEVQISLCTSDDMVIFSIDDNGKGFDPAAVKTNHSFGILGMKERVLSLAGKFALVTAPGNGTKITVQLPLTVSKDI
ncbi:MAG: PAS domain S-box protein [Chitinophagaceae bacterium]